jgi:hypothetical protein
VHRDFQDGGGRIERRIDSAKSARTQFGRKNCFAADLVPSVLVWHIGIIRAVRPI